MWSVPHKPWDILVNTYFSQEIAWTQIWNEAILCIYKCLRHFSAFATMGSQIIRISRRKIFFKNDQISFKNKFCQFRHVFNIHLFQSSTISNKFSTNVDQFSTNLYKIGWIFHHFWQKFRANQLIAPKSKTLNPSEWSKWIKIWRTTQNVDEKGEKSIEQYRNRVIPPKTRNSTNGKIESKKPNPKP